MVDYSTGDLVLLALQGVDEPESGGVAPDRLTLPGLSETLNLGEERMADRIALMSAVSELVEQGLVTERID